MNRGLIQMSHKESIRHTVVVQVIEKRLTQKEAGKRLKISERQVKRLCRAYRLHGVNGLLSKKRGKRGNHQLEPQIKIQIKALLKTDYLGFGPTLAAEKLLERQGIKVSKETIRQVLIEENPQRVKSKSASVIHPHREPRSYCGELIQIDGSPHAWFENRGIKCCLIAFIDDATSKIMYLQLEEAETTFAYFRGVKSYLAQHGLPGTFYSDKHSIFRINQGNGIESQTQFERAMEELGIETICANSPQAKGRVERANRTLQDRLVKELRLQKINDKEAANAFLPTFIEAYNKKFGRQPKSSESGNVPCIVDPDKLNLILSIHRKRKVTKNLEISFENQIYQIKEALQGRRLQQAEVTVCQTLNNDIKLIYNGKILTYEIHKKQKKTAQILTDKTLNPYLDNLRFGGKTKPKIDHPWKRTLLSKKSHQIYPSISGKVPPTTG